MLRHGRKATFRRFVFPKRCSPRGTRAAGHRVPTHIMPRAVLKLERIDNTPDVEVPTHTMLRAALKHVSETRRLVASPVPTHIMLRAALKRHIDERFAVLCEVPTHTMPRAALKRMPTPSTGRAYTVPTHTMLRAALKLCSHYNHSFHFHVPTHTMLRAALTAKRLCVSFRSHRAVFVCEKRTAILTMRRTDVRIEIQKGTA